MRKTNYIWTALLLVTAFTLYSCGSSNVGGTGSSSDVAFDPSANSSLEVIHYTALQQRILVTFGLTSGSAAYTMLTSKKSIFDRSDPEYNALFAVNYTLIMAKACELSPAEVLFPDGKVEIDTAWKKLTGKPMNSDASELEAEVLADVASQPDDVKMFALCLGVALDVNSTFINYVE